LAPILIDGNTALYGIIGNPLGHSFSPEMHTLSFQHLNLNAVYVPFPVQENDLSSIPSALSLIGVRGFNVTVPFKEKIIPFLDEISTEARILGSVNTVVKNGNEWKGFSTDGSGFVRATREDGIRFTDKKVLLIGGGGAAKAVSLAIAMEGVSHLHLINRTQKKAQKIAETLLKESPAVITEIGYDTGDRFDILINCTSVGMKSDECPVAEELIESSGCVIDIIYNPPWTSLIKKANKAGIPAFNGLGMLLYQGIEAFEIWTGQTAPVDVMRQSLQRSMDRIT